MVEVVVLIPLSGNDGAAFTSEQHAAFEAFVLTRFGGLSRLSGTVAGKWLADGTTYTDELVAYAIAMQSITDGGLLREVVEFAKAHYAQEAIFVRYLGLAEVL